MSDKIIGLDELAEKHKNLGDGEVILDVRNPDEYEEMHIPGALNLPLGNLEETYEQLKSYKAVYIHCKMGGRARKAFELLTDLGLDNLHCLQEAGIVAWDDAGHPCNKK
jgi:rhodanese-related sulfurtransferase